MKTKMVLSTLVAALCFLTTMAQENKLPEEKREKIEAMKAAFITQRLDLTTEEAQQFWPVYNEYQKNQDALRQQQQENRKAARANFEEMSDKELEELIDNEIIFEQQKLDLRKKYHAKFKEVLPMKKVALLYKAEHDFKKMLLKKIQERRSEHQPGRK